MEKNTCFFFSVSKIHSSKDRCEFCCLHVVYNTCTSMLCTIYCLVCYTYIKRAKSNGLLISVKYPLLLNPTRITVPLSVFALLCMGGVSAKIKQELFLPETGSQTLSLSLLMRGLHFVVLWLDLQKDTGVGLFLLSLLYPVSPPSRMAASTTTPLDQVWMKWDACRVICLWQA